MNLNGIGKLKHFYRSLFFVLSWRYIVIYCINIVIFNIGIAQSYVLLKLATSNKTSIYFRLDLAFF